MSDVKNEEINLFPKDIELQEYKHSNKERLCYYSNELYDKTDIVKYKMTNRHFGSIFDGDTYEIQLQKDIAKDLDDNDILKKEWFDNNKMKIGVDRHGCAEYEHEQDIYNFIKGLSIYNREYIENCDNYLISKSNRDVWIKDEYKPAMINNRLKDVDEDCDFCKELLDYNSACYLPWYEEGICHSEYNVFYLIPQLDGELEDSLRPYMEIEYCPKCGKKLEM